MYNPKRPRTLRVLAGGALLVLLSKTTLADAYVPEHSGLWKPAVSADLTGPDVSTLLAADSTAPVFRMYFTNLEPVVQRLDPRQRVSEPPPPGHLRPESHPVWVYHRGQWTLAIGSAGEAAGSASSMQLLKDVDEPTAFLLMGSGLIFMVVGLRYHRRRGMRQGTRDLRLSPARLVPCLPTPVPIPVKR